MPWRITRIPPALVAIFPPTWLEPLEAGVSNRVILYFDYSVKDLTDAPLLALSAGAGLGC